MTTVNDSWDQPSSSSRSNNATYRPAPPVHSVPDAWDDEEDEEEEDNQKIWEDANTRAPMPELIISSSGITPTAVPPSVTAFQTPMRILKRPSSHNTTANSSSSQTPIETLAQKEARYQAARERIFGGDDGSGSNVTENGNGTSKRDGDDQKRNPATPAVNVVRNPIGPSEIWKDEGGQVYKGFRRRSTKGPVSSEQTAPV